MNFIDSQIRRMQELLNEILRRLFNLEKIASRAFQKPSGGGSVFAVSSSSISIFLTTSPVTGASGTPWTPGTGYGDQYYWDSSSWVAGATGVLLNNINEKTIATGAYVVGGQDYVGKWWVLTPDKCANLS